MIVNPPVVRGLAPSDTGARIRRTPQPGSLPIDTPMNALRQDLPNA